MNACHASTNCPTDRLVHTRDLYTAEELKRSATYNEALLRGCCQGGLRVRLDGPGRFQIAWNIGDPAAASDGWGAARIAMVTTLLPHVRQFVYVRQALVRAEARSATMTSLLDNPRVGVVHLDQCGRILEVNDRARDIVRNGDGLLDPGRNAARSRGRRPGSSRAAVVRCLAGVQRARGQRVDASPALVRVAAIRRARQAGGRPATRLRSAARSGAGAD